MMLSTTPILTTPSASSLSEAPATVKGDTTMDPAQASSRLDLLYPLSEFFERGEPRPLAELEAGKRTMPEPYRSLLVHDSDMTSTLERFHGEPLHLRLLRRHRQGDSLFRQVVLLGQRTGHAVEFGAIRIDLTAFAEVPRQRILEAKQPLGSILAEFEVPYQSRPRLFFHVESNGHMEDVLGFEGPATLYGRQNVLSRPDGVPIAEVVEILPPNEAALDGVG